MPPQAQVKLTASPPQTPTLLEAVVSVSEPLVVALCILWYGLPRAIGQQISTLSPSKMLNPWAWRDAVWAHGSPHLLEMSDAGTFDAKKEFVGQAYGTVLEVGAGSGETTKYYDEDKVDKLYALEPFPPLVTHLRRTLAARSPSFRKKGVVVPLGIQEKSLLQSEYNILNESIDTLVLVRCLCSIPQPKKHLKYCVELLKPGGTLIMIEHVSSTHPTTRLLQDLFTPPWSFIANGCEMNRDSLGALVALQCWEDVTIKRPVGQTTANLFHWVFVKAVKKR